uniref:CSON004219 protein n=1 Tax=Culicoides sonorensis TaxID=179676 RepID=A0A336MS09_CULSO
MSYKRCHVVLLSHLDAKFEFAILPKSCEIGMKLIFPENSEKKFYLHQITLSVKKIQSLTHRFH